MSHNRRGRQCDDVVIDLARRLEKEEDEHAGEQQLADALHHLEIHAMRFVAVEQEAKIFNVFVRLAVFDLLPLHDLKGFAV